MATQQLCSWKLFSESSKDCTMCLDYEQCRDTLEAAHVAPPRSNIALDVIEDDAKEYAEMIRELDILNDVYSDERATPQPEQPEDSEEGAVLSEEFVETKGYKELLPVATFLEKENIPVQYIPPDNLYVANFMMVSFTTGKLTVRTTSTQGIPFTAKFIKKLFKGDNKITFKYTKRDSIDVMLPIIKSIVFSRKNNG